MRPGQGPDPQAPLPLPVAGPMLATAAPVRTEVVEGWFSTRRAEPEGTLLAASSLTEQRVPTPAEEAVVKADRRPPAGLGLDDDAARGGAATMEEEPGQGFLEAPPVIPRLGDTAVSEVSA
jgi:hypothetical protein